MARLSLSLLGSFQITLNGELIRGFKSNKVRALLAYLAVESGRQHPRETLAGLLWPNLPDRAARANLRTALYDLRLNIADKKADPPHLLVAGDNIQFNKASDSWLDVESFKRCVAAGLNSSLDPEPWRRAIELYQGPFLEGFSPGDCLAFEEWALMQREVFSRQLISALEQLAACYGQRGQFSEAEGALRQRLQLEPLDEAIHRRLMRLLAASGQRTAALGQYGHCQQILSETLEVRPSDRTRKLYKQIQDGELVRGGGIKEGGRAILSMPSPSSTTASIKPKTIFVGFETELAHLNRHLDKALAGNGQVLFVTGEAGRGKTMLLAEFCCRALKTHSHLLAATGRADAQHGHGDPYQPFREALRMLSGSVETAHAWCEVTEEHSRLLRRALPTVLQTLVEQGPDLIGNFLPADNLARLAQDVGAPGDPWRLRLEALVGHQGVDPDGSSPTPEQAKAAAAGPALNQAALFDQLTHVLQALSIHFPLILALDDLQWADAGSASLLFHLGRRLEGYRILIIGAYRRVELALGSPKNGSRRRERHPLEPILHEFQRDFGEIQIDLNRVDGRGFVEALVDIEPNRLVKDFREALFRHSGGNPLFTVELLRSLQDRGELVKDEDGRWVAGRQLDWDQLPSRVEAVIAERFGRLPDRCQSTLATASLQGQDFIADVVAQAQSADGQAIIGCLSDQVCRQHRLVQAVGSEQYGGRHVSRFCFRHQLFQQYAYQQMDAVTKDRMHERTAIALEALYTGQIEEHALELGQHFEAAGWAEKAASYFLLAGKHAYLMAANMTAIDHFRRGLKLLADRPPSKERDQRELALQLALSAPLRAVYGQAAAEVGRACTRAYELAQEAGDPAHLFPAQFLLWGYHLARAEYELALAIGLKLLDQAETEQQPLPLAQAHLALGGVQLCLGNLRSARNHAEAILGRRGQQEPGFLIAPFIGSQIQIGAQITMAWASWFVGYADQALEGSEQALAMTRQLNHPYSLAMVLALSECMVRLLRREYRRLEPLAEELVNCSSENGFSLFNTWGQIFQGRAWAELGRVEEGLETLDQGLAAFRATGQRWNLTLVLALLAEVQPNINAGQGYLAEALALVEETGERIFEAELHRLRGELMLKNLSAGGADGSDPEETLRVAAACFQQAIEISQDQEAKSLELRAATSLARLWHGQGRIEQAQQLLAEINGWFSEGFDTADLQETQEILEELRSDAHQIIRAS